MLLELTVKLHSSFQEYMIPTVTISDRSVDDVVTIFERINSTGTKLEAVDFLRAATWSEDFDLNKALGLISEVADKEGFKIPDETVVKIFAMSLQKIQAPESMLGLRYLPSAELDEAVQSQSYLNTAIKFLKEECLVFSYDFIPYQGQLLILIKYILESGPSYSNNLKQMKKWFWSVSFNEGYRGKPDSYIVRDLKDTSQFVRGERSPLTTKLTLSIDDLFERSFIKGKALSAAVANLFAITGVRSLSTGKKIDYNKFISEFSSRNFDGIIEINDIRKIFGPKQKSNRIFSKHICNY